MGEMGSPHMGKRVVPKRAVRILCCFLCARCGATARPWRGLSAIHVSWQMTYIHIASLQDVHVHGAWRTHESGSDSLDSLSIMNIWNVLIQIQLWPGSLIDDYTLMTVMLMRMINILSSI